jgi:hypothetical protein
LGKFFQERANCLIVPADPTVYKLNTARAEAYYSAGIRPPARLIDCMILSQTDWACSYSVGSGGVVVIDGSRRSAPISTSPRSGVISSTSGGGNGGSRSCGGCSAGNHEESG